MIIKVMRNEILAEMKLSFEYFPLMEVLFIRQGMDSSQDEIGACAILGSQLDDELGGGPVQV